MLRSSTFLIATLLLAACGGDRRAVQNVATVSAKTVLAQLARTATPRTFAGTVRAENVSTIAARVPGTVTRVHVQAGDRVRAGQLLLEIDGREADAAAARARAGAAEADRALDSAQAAVDAAEAHAALAKSTYERVAALHERGSLSAQALDEASAGSRAASADLERARQTYQQALARRADTRGALAQAGLLGDFTRITAPFDGIVTARMVDPGAQAAPGVPLLAVDGATKFRVETTVDESVQVNPGDRVVVRAGDGLAIASTVTQVVAAIDPRTRSSLVRIALPGESFRSGALVDVEFTGAADDTVTVPASAIASHGGVKTLFVVDRAGIARLRLVTTGAAGEDDIEVLSGVDPGERVVRTGTPELRDGVRIVSVASEAPASPGEEPL